MLLIRNRCLCLLIENDIRNFFSRKQWSDYTHRKPHSDISSVQPSIGINGSCRLFWIFVVSLEYVVSLGAYFSFSIFRKVVLFWNICQLDHIAQDRCSNTTALVISRQGYGYGGGCLSLPVAYTKTSIFGNQIRQKNIKREVCTYSRRAILSVPATSIKFTSFKWYAGRRPGGTPKYRISVKKKGMLARLRFHACVAFIVEKVYF